MVQVAAGDTLVRHKREIVLSETISHRNNLRAAVGESPALDTYDSAGQGQGQLV